MVEQTLAGLGKHVASLCNFNDTWQLVKRFLILISCNKYLYTLDTHLIKKLIIVQKLAHFFNKVMCFYFKVKVNRYVSLYIETSGVWITSTSGGTYACAVLTKSILSATPFAWHLNKKKQWLAMIRQRQMSKISECCRIFNQS